MQTFKSPDGNDDRKTLVDEGTELKGALKSTCPVVVRGKVDGEVTAPAIDVSATGSLHGRMKAGTFVSAGEIAGELEADTVQLSGTVKDKTAIRAKSLDVKLGTGGPKSETRFGECVLEVGTIPSKEATIAACLSGGARSADSASKAAGAQPSGKGEPGDAAAAGAASHSASSPAGISSATNAATAASPSPSVPAARSSEAEPSKEGESRKDKASVSAGGDPGAAIMSALSDASADPEPAPPSMLARGADGTVRKAIAPKRL